MYTNVLAIITERDDALFTIFIFMHSFDID